jgi:hypothetical protein
MVLVCGLAHMRIEFLSGHALSPDELGFVRSEIEGATDISAASDELRGILARNTCSPSSHHRKKADAI